MESLETAELLDLMVEVGPVLKRSDKLSILEPSAASADFLSWFPKLRTLDVFVVSGDVLQLREADGFGADEGANALRVFAALEDAPVTHDHHVHVGVHLGVDEGDVVNQVDAAVSDRFDRGGTTAVHTYSGRKRREK